MLVYQDVFRDILICKSEPMQSDKDSVLVSMENDI